MKMSFFENEIKTRERMFPEFRFNMDSCLGTKDCAKCLQACVPSVLSWSNVITDETDSNFKNSKNYVPCSTYPSKCTACMRCIEVCPKKNEGAITVEFKSIRVPKKVYNKNNIN